MSKNTSYGHGKISDESGNHVLYYLQYGPDRAFVHEELMHIPEDTQEPTEWVNKLK